MKKLLVILLCVCLLVIGYMIGTKDTDITFDKVYEWTKQEIPEQISKLYTIKGYDIVENENGTVDIIIHCIKNEEKQNEEV